VAEAAAITGTQRDETVAAARHALAKLEARSNDLDDQVVVDVLTTVAIWGELSSSKARQYADRAFRSAQTLTDDDVRSAALLRVVKAYSRLGHYSEARSAARLCTKTEDRMSAYAAILREHNRVEGLGLEDRMRAHPADACLEQNPFGRVL
jgi:hypothetical protein